MFRMNRNSCFSFTTHELLLSLSSQHAQTKDRLGFEEKTALKRKAKHLEFTVKLYGIIMFTISFLTCVLYVYILYLRGKY